MLSTLIGYCLLIPTATVAVTPPSFERAREPQIAVDLDGRTYCAYGMGDSVYVSVSDDEGRTFGEPIKVGEAGKLSLGMRRGPRIAARKGVVTVTAISGEQGRGRDENLLSFVSRDRGRTWSRPVRINDVPASAREGLHAMAQAPDGTVACVWLDLREKGTQLFMAFSRDGGATWAPDRLAYASPSGTICECCHPSLAFDAKGTLVAMFRNVLDGARDMYVTESRDLKTFSTAQKLGSGTWKLDACPMDGGMVAVAGNGAVQTVWRRGSEVFMAGKGGEETRIAEGRNPWMGIVEGRVVLVWQAGTAVEVSRGGQSGARLTESGNDPVVGVAPDGRFGLLVWNEKGVRASRL